MVDIKKLSVVFLVLAVASTSAQRQHCPKDCVCFRKTIRCNQLGLTQIPAFPYDTLVVDIRLNHIRGVSPRTFANLVHAHTVYLSSNEIDFITDESFLGLRSLVQLYLNNNHLSTIPAGAFRNHPQLEGLYLENNDIWEMDPAAFVQLPRLSRLSLNNNKITTMPKNVFADLKNLRNLRLDGNPINCDCSVETLLLMQKSAKHPVAIYLTCEAPPNLHKREYAALRLTDFHCEMPQMIREPHDVETDIGETVELPCQVAGDPEPEVFWMYNTNEIIEDDHPKVEILKTGSLRINTVDTNDFGIYECIGRNEIGEIKSQPIRMVVKNNRIVSQHEKPQFNTQPKDTIISLGDGMILDCSASGLPEPEIRWSFNGRMLVQSTSSIRILSNGSLEILSATLSNAGVYKCEASNELGTIEGKATIDVKELPVFIHTPQNETFNKGQTAILECDAEGNPLPVIKWNFNGQLLVEGNRISLENENTELIIKDLKQSDSGIYTCIASNDNGASEAEAVITVKSAYSGPRLVASPYDIEAFSGTTIELPCKGDDHSAVVKWQKDGRFVVSSERFQISSSGSLYIKNATLSDTGRYECSIKNEHGRATASGLVTIRSSEDLAPGDKYVRVAFAEAAKEIDLAINNTIATLFSNRTLSNPLHHGDLLRMFRFPKGEARQLARAAEIYERTLVNIRKHVQAGHNLSVDSDNYEFNDLLSREHLHLVAELSGCMEHREMPNCTDMCYHSKYRSIDGTCNNLNNPIWGASLTAFKRLRKPEYENGFSMPIGWTKGKLYSGYPKPISRLVSTTLISTKDITPDDRITHMVMQWGQFLDHDLDHAIPSVSSESWDGIDCKKTCEFAAPCYPIEVPPNDPRVKNRRCIDLIRSSAICGSGMTSVFFDAIQPREQINQLTSFIDASQVYGYTFEFAQELRNLTTDDGLLRTGVHFPNQKDMLPFAAPQDGMDCRRNLNENNMNCFVAGDIRVNEQLGLLAMHTIWMREHNRIAIKLKEINPHWDGDTLYQEARKVVGAQMQHITYKQWLPIIIGEEGMKRLGEYKGYDPSINPSVSNEFATAAFRFGHTLINPILHRLDENYQPIPQGHISLHKAFFAPWRIAYEGGVDPLMRGLFTVAAKLKRPDQNLNSELTEKLFLSSHAVALDLASMNIQRGREHGIPSYNTYRAFCNLTVAKTFDDLSKEISSEEVINKLKELYGHPDNIDIFVGGILEDPADGGKIGPLFQCLLVDQFKRLRDGDRFFYENPSVFLPQQLQQIKQTNLARVLCDNGDHIKEAPKDVFLLPGLQGGYTNCADIPGINLYFWQDCGSCESLPKLFDSYVPETYPKRKKRSLATDENLPKNINPGLKEDVETKYDPLIVVQKKIDDLKRKVKEFEKQILHLERSCSSIKLLQENVCTDLLGHTRMNSETWISGDCITCQCNQSHIICSQTKCPEVKCDPGMEPKLLPNECCPICTDLKHKQGSVILK